MEMELTIKSNEELYGDFELIPLNTDAVQQRIDFFRKKVEETINGDQVEFYKYHKAWIFWIGIKDNHCVKEK